ncbi:MAG: hypothetical protein ABH879_10000 [archaeon]
MQRFKNVRLNCQGMKTKAWAIMLIVSCTIFSSAGQYFFKAGAAKLVFDLAGLITNYNIMLGFLLYGIACAGMIIALKNGELSVLYPFVSLSFVWVSAVSVYVLGETLTAANWGGVAVIIAGVSLLGYGARNG